MELQMPRPITYVYYKIKYIVDNYLDDGETKNKFKLALDNIWSKIFNEAPENVNRSKWEYFGNEIEKCLSKDYINNVWETKIVNIYLDNEDGSDIPN